MKWAPGTRVRSLRGRRRLGTVVGRVGSFLAVQWDGANKPRPYTNWYASPSTSPLQGQDYPDRTWSITGTGSGRLEVVD